MEEQIEIEALWSREKYRVMYFSQRHYDEIRGVLKRGTDLKRVEILIEEAVTLEPTKGSIINAYQHMWGYFKKYALLSERDTYINKMSAFENDEIEGKELMDFILQLAAKYEVNYLLKSTILDETLHKGTSVNGK